MPPKKQQTKVNGQASIPATPSSSKGKAKSLATPSTNTPAPVAPPPTTRARSMANRNKPVAHPTFETRKHRRDGWAASSHDLWTRYKGTFAFSMFETWEVVLIHTILFVTLALLYVAVVQYLPSHIKIITSRAKYYLFGPGAGRTEYVGGPGSAGAGLGGAVGGDVGSAGVEGFGVL